MAGKREFDDARSEDQEGFSECFLCGFPVAPGDPASGTYGLRGKHAPQLRIHVPCLDGRDMMAVASAYRRTINDFARTVRGTVH